MRDYAGELPVYLELDLFRAGWNGVLDPYPGEDVRQVAMRALRKSVMKKFMNSAIQKADAAALKLFMEINEKCRTFSLKDAPLRSDVQAIALGEAKDWIYRFCYPDGYSGSILNLASISEGLGVGSGANIGVKGTSFLSKVGLSTMSATSQALHLLYKDAISDQPLWSDVESIRSKFRPTDIVRGSRLSFVPKTREISRTICTEPLCNMLFQKGIGAVLEARLKQVSGIDLALQPDRNRALCRLGSLHGQFGTIDLSSASDSMSNSLVREFFPPDFVRWLELTRSPVTILPDGTELELHMVSSMGNAFTFPLQTILFTSLVYGAYRALGLRFLRPHKRSLGSFAVFGDDIIVWHRAYDLVTELLNICGFSVNVDKSFNRPNDFRESCGHDYFKGHNVRGVYIGHLKDDCDKYSAINRLNRWSARWDIPLPETIGYLRKGLRTLYVPFDEADTSGIKVPHGLVSTPRALRFGALKYRFLAIESRSSDVSDVESRSPRIEGWFNNHSAVLLAAVAGTLRSGKVVHRSNVRLTRVKQSTCPRWDWWPAEYRVSGSPVDHWKVIFGVNLNLLG